MPFGQSTRRCEARGGLGDVLVAPGCLLSAAPPLPCDGSGSAAVVVCATRSGPAMSGAHRYISSCGRLWRPSGDARIWPPSGSGVGSARHQEFLLARAMRAPRQDAPADHKQPTRRSLGHGTVARAAAISLEPTLRGLRANNIGTCRGLSGILNAAERLQPS